MPSLFCVWWNLRDSHRVRKNSKRRETGGGQPPCKPIESTMALEQNHDFHARMKLT
jgi:hypothetical protein